MKFFLTIENDFFLNFSPQLSFFDEKKFGQVGVNISIKNDGNGLLLVRVIHHDDHLAVLIRLTLLVVCRRQRGRRTRCRHYKIYCGVTMFMAIWTQAADG